MEGNFENRDFEQFVKRNADQYRMYPSEKVWKGIYTSIHTRRNWYGVASIFLILSSIVATWMIVHTPEIKQQSNNIDIQAPNILNDNHPVSEKNSDISAIMNPKTIQKKNKSTIHTDSKPLLAYNQTLETPTQTKTNTYLHVNKINPVINPGHSITFRSNENIILTNEVQNENLNSSNLTIKERDDDKYYSPEKAHLRDLTNTIQTNGEKIANPAIHENTMNPVQPTVNSKKLKWQFFLTPTISYRRLTENKSYLHNNSPYASANYSYANYYNVNNVVTHKPDMGFEIGFATIYPILKKTKIRAGMQFNINRYGIKAFSYSNEVATITLNSSGVNDSLNQVTQYRNFNGYNSGWLQNLYFSVSAPIGVEYDFGGSNKTRFGIVGTIQPTYIISDKAYLISTDYKNYVEVPWLVRRWNMNTGLEMFVNYSSGKLDWQVGPQIRYQLLSSFQNKYPVKENLFDFGLKVGVMLKK